MIVAHEKRLAIKRRLYFTYDYHINNTKWPIFTFVGSHRNVISSTAFASGSKRVPPQPTLIEKIIEIFTITY